MNHMNLKYFNFLHRIREWQRLRLAHWNTYLRNRRMPAELRTMILDYQRSAGNQASKFWIRGGDRHIRQLLGSGYENFKQTLAFKYFTWAADRNHHQMDFLMENLSPEIVTQAKARGGSSQFYTITFLLWEYALKQGLGEILKSLSEPTEGNPLSVSIDGREMSQDLINSVLEYDSIMNSTPPIQINTVMEIGAGYGRTAFVFLKLLPRIRYIIVDIPPALYVSQRYLSGQFSDRKIFRYRNFASFYEIEGEFNTSQVAFLMPHQLAMIPDKSIDIVAAIDSLHEMKKDTIAYYFSAANRIADKFFYFKCWKNTNNTLDNVALQERDYPIPSQWNKIYSRECRVQVEYFEALYAVRGKI